MFVPSGEMPVVEPLNPLEMEAESAGSTLAVLTVSVFSGAVLESAAVVRTPADSETLKVECTKLDDSG